MELPKIYVLFCRRRDESNGIAEQAFMIQKNAEMRRKEYQSQYSDDTDFYIREFVIDDWKEFLTMNNE